MLSVIIMTLNAQPFLRTQLRRLLAQSMPPDELIVADSGSEDDTLRICAEFSGVRVLHIPRGSFDHGASRDFALRESRGDIVIFLTQDAIPADRHALRALTDFLQRGSHMAAAYGRQLPRRSSPLYEQYVREFSYPAESFVRYEKDIPAFGIKVFNLSNAFAAYRRDAYFALGGFPHPIKTNEDMMFAAHAVRSGWGIGYAAKARVIHSHNFTLRQQYRRNFLIGYELERHRALLQGAPADRQGMRMVRHVSLRLLSGLHGIAFLRFGLDCCARLLGSRMGRRKRQKEQAYAK